MRDIILGEMRRVAQEQKKLLAPLEDATPLLSSGLDSLCFAILVARLEEKLGSDPFSNASDAVLPVTFGDLVAFYEHAPV